MEQLLNFLGSIMNFSNVIKIHQCEKHQITCTTIDLQTEFGHWMQYLGEPKLDPRQQEGEDPPAY